MASSRQAIMLLGRISALGSGSLFRVRGNPNSMGNRDLLAETMVPLLDESDTNSSISTTMHSQPPTSARMIRTRRGGSHPLAGKITRLEHHRK